MSALAGENVVFGAVPIHSGLPKSGSGGDHRLIAHRLPLDLVECDHVFGLESGNAPGIGFEIINQESFLDLEFVGQALGFNDPGKIRRLYPPVAHRARNAKTGCVGMQLGRIHELGHDFVQAGVIATGKDGSGNQAEAAVHGIEKCQPSVGTSNVACQNHFSKSLQ